MEWLVKEIQRNILDNESITIILRKALVLGRKLKLNDFTILIEKELNWYKKDDKLPDYRNITWYRIIWWNPYHWWQIVNFTEQNTFEKVVSTQTYDPISEIEKLAWSKEWLERLLPTWLMSKATWFTTEYKVCHTNADFLNIVEKLKNIILEECLTLEEKWILWEWISFTKEEVKKAESVTNVYIWAMTDTQLQINSNNSVQTKTYDQVSIETLKKLIQDTQANQDYIKTIPCWNEIISSLNEISEEVNKDVVDNKIISWKIEALKEILVWVSWNIFATWILKILSELSF